MSDAHAFGGDRLRVLVQADGAEPVSIRDQAGTELLWQAGPQWPRHAPVLFPIVGRLANDTLRHDGQDFRMTQHGFARDRRFTWLERGPDACRLSLHDDDATRAMFPFPFRLEIGYRANGARLDVEYAVHNPGNGVLPVSLGAHPAFRWPLVDGTLKTSHRLVFEQPEPAPIRRVSGGLLRADAEPTPVENRILALSESLFADDAVILDRPASGSVLFEAEDAPDALRLRVAWHGMTQLGIWSKPGADFLCIEPWHGLASPEGFDGDVMDKPFGLRLAPGETRRLGWSVEALDGAA